MPTANSPWSYRLPPYFLRRIGGLSIFSNLLACLLLCVATIFKSTFALRDAPCKLGTIGFQDISSFYSTTDNKEKQKLMRVVKNCVTDDSVVILYCCFALIILSLLCSIIQFFANLNLNLKFVRKIKQRGALDICCVFIDCVCLGLMYIAASSISRSQFELLKHQLPKPDFSTIEETRSFIKNATKTLDAFSITFSGGFYIVLLAGLASLVSFATHACYKSTNSSRNQSPRRVEPNRPVHEPTIIW